MVVAVFILGNQIFCLNVGDSRAVLCRKGKAISLSVDHKSTNEKEKKRVMKNGGNIFGGRLMGKLIVTRAFGDFSLKVQTDEMGTYFFKNYLTCEPEVRVIEIDADQDEFIMIASDGLFDKMTNQNCIDLIKNQLSHGTKDMHKVASIVAAKSIKRDKSKDNVTLIVISLN